MIVYLLWFNEWEDRYCLGLFETEKEAQRYKDYFIKYPIDSDYGPDMVHFSERDEYENRFHIESRKIGELEPKIDNLHFLEFCEGQKNPQGA